MLISQKDVKNDSWSPVLKAICWLIKKKKILASLLEMVFVK